MAEFKTLQFPNTPAGQAAKVRALERETAAGWRVVSETIVPGKFRGGQACCFFLIFAPCAFLAGHHDDVITVTLERGSPPATASFDRPKWNALLQYDKDIAAAAEQVRPFGAKWMDEFAAAYLALNDNRYLPEILATIVKRAEAEETETKLRLAKQAAQEQERARQLQQLAEERKARYAQVYKAIWGTNTRRIWTMYLLVGFAIGLFLLARLLQSAAESHPESTTGTANQPVSPPAQQAAVSAPRPSFDCARVHSEVLKLICATPELAAYDQQLAAAYSAAAKNSTSPSTLKADERAWIKLRNNSDGTVATLRQLYQSRIAALSANGPGVTAVTPNEMHSWDMSKDGDQKTYVADGVSVTLARGMDEQGNAAPQITVKSADGRTGRAVGEPWSSDQVRADFGVGRIDSHSDGSQVVFSTYSGGAHCCTGTKVLELTKSGWVVLDLGEHDGESPAFPKDENGTSTPAFVLYDDRFLYAFASHADSYSPPLVYLVADAKIIDMSASGRYRTLYEKDLAQAQAGCRNHQNGACAGFVADAARLGRFDDAWQIMLQDYNKTDDWALPTDCDVDQQNGQCPDGHKHKYDNYPDALRAFLVRNGYISGSGQ